MRIAQMRLHATGQWMVKLAGKCHYLGSEKDKAEDKYRELIVEHYGPSRAIIESSNNKTTVAELIEQYVKHRVQSCVVKYQKKTEENYRQVTRHLLGIYGELPAEDFGPKAYKTVRQQMAEEPGRNFAYINKLCSRMKAAWKWGVSEELVSESSYRRLLTVSDLKAGDLGLPDSEEVLPVSLELFEATLPYLTDICADFLRLLWICGARPSELINLTPAEIERDGKHLVYRPKNHKTKRKNKLRAIVFGCESENILKKHWPSVKTDRFFGCYSDSAVVRKAVYRACKRANLTHWHPYQLRHAAVTRISLEHGKEVATAVAGHAKAVTTERYDHTAIEKAKRAAG